MCSGFPFWSVDNFWFIVFRVQIIGFSGVLDSVRWIHFIGEWGSSIMLFITDVRQATHVNTPVSWNLLIHASLRVIIVLFFDTFHCFK